jgi:hypothetical protein
MFYKKKQWRPPRQAKRRKQENSIFLYSPQYMDIYLFYFFGGPGIWNWQVNPHHHPVRAAFCKHEGFLATVRSK